MIKVFHFYFIFEITDEIKDPKKEIQQYYRRCWRECEALSRFEKTRESVMEYNRANKWKKRGLSMVPVKFGIAFGRKHLNQSGALVMVYQDGSVLLSHGGTEMGQGLHTKMIQVAATVLGKYGSIGGTIYFGGLLHENMRGSQTQSSQSSCRSRPQ